jgi:ADP-heptose:LPS heptosyltransferase
MSDFLLIRLSSLGDIIHTLPAFSALRKTFLGAKITWAVESPGKEILELVPGIDQILVCRKNPLAAGFRTRKKATIALDFQGLLKSAVLAFFSGAHRRLGFNRLNLKEPLARFFYTETIPPVDEFAHHVIYKNFCLLEPLGIKPELGTKSFDFPLLIPSELKNQVQEKLVISGFSAGQPLIIFNVGASWPSKRLSAQFWVEVINGTKERVGSGKNLLLLWGNEEELSLAQAVQEKTDVSLIPFLSVKEVVALLSLTSLLISGDTFALQVAGALNIPCVGLFGPTSPIRNGPFRPHDAIIYADVDCSPCYYRTCAAPRCWQSIDPQKVIDSIANQVKTYVRGN